MNDVVNTPFPYESEILWGKMLHARVSIVGVGGLGSWTAELLTRMGIGRIRLLDCATVRETDLKQHMAVTEVDVDRAKVTVVADRLSAINSQILLETFFVELTEDSIDDFLVGSDIVFDTTGGSAIRTALFMYCCRRGVQYVSCEANGFCAQVMVCRGNEGSNALLPAPLLGRQKRLPAMVAMAASLSVQEIVKLLTGYGVSLNGQTAIFNTEKNTWVCTPLKRLTSIGAATADEKGEAH